MEETNWKTVLDEYNLTGEVRINSPGGFFECGSAANVKKHWRNQTFNYVLMDDLDPPKYKLPRKLKKKLKKQRQKFILSIL